MHDKTAMVEMLYEIKQKERIMLLLLLLWPLTPTKEGHVT